MKKLLALYLLVTLMAGCNRNVEPSEPNAATIVSGTYQLIKVTGPMNPDVALANLKPYSTLVVTKITPTSAKATYTTPYGTSPFSETWNLTKVAADTVKIKSQISVIEKYQNGLIVAGFADATFYLWFEQLK
ncbi:hypothetical protein GCM10028803_00880 [Larkinella knui]|uniref:Lipocalin-like domain-containing protein n=1 Tax=Larkinella knui TaxID=2025310 RepID=A0A3P1CMQ6_9BACT|nr:hypothetical protein [Larkinella knui]RRB14204.1 hypothetical protein EHT87_18390 [Larkinella knui]